MAHGAPPRNSTWLGAHVRALVPDEILEDRYDRRSTLIPSQLPLDRWHAYLGDRTVADAMLDRLVHHSYRLVLKGDA